MLIRIFFSIVLVLCLAPGAGAESAVWQVQKGTATFYLGGTFHILRAGDYPLPPEYDRAYREAQLVVFETELDRFAEPETQHQMLTQALYADGSTLDKHLAPATYKELADHCAAAGIPLKHFARFKPALVMVTLTLGQLAKLGATQQGVDQHIHARARQDRKSILGLETVAEQISHLIAMADGNEDEFVRHGLQDLQTLAEQLDRMVAAWRRGDEAQLEALLTRDLQTRYPSLYRRLITDRNRQWLPTIEGYGQTPEIEFVLVGVGHLVGPEGLVALLRDRGFTVRKL